MDSTTLCRAQANDAMSRRCDDAAIQCRLHTSVTAVVTDSVRCWWTMIQWSGTFDCFAAVDSRVSPFRLLVVCFSTSPQRHLSRISSFSLTLAPSSTHSFSACLPALLSVLADCRLLSSVSTVCTFVAWRQFALSIDRIVNSCDRVTTAPCSVMMTNAHM